MVDSFLERAKHGLVPLHNIIYANNLLQNAVIDAYKEGKIPLEAMEKILYADDEE